VPATGVGLWVGGLTCQQLEPCGCVRGSEHPARLADEWGARSPCVSLRVTHWRIWLSEAAEGSRPTAGEIMRSEGVIGETCLHVCACPCMGDTGGEQGSRSSS